MKLLRLLNVMDGSAFIMINKNGFYVLDRKVCLLSLCVVVASFTSSLYLFFPKPHCRRMNDDTRGLNEHNHGNFRDKHTALKQVITLKATCDDKKVQRKFRFQFPFIVSSMNSIHPSTRVNISGSPIADSHDSYPLLTMPTTFFFPFRCTTSACPESPAEFRLNSPQKTIKPANLNKSKRRCRARK